MFLPLHDHNGLTHVMRPYVTWGLIAINVLIYFLVQGGGISEASSASAYSFGLIPSVFFDTKELATELYAVPDDLTLVTYAFFHGDLMHLAGNMLFLWVFGDNVEDAMGHVKYLIFYLACAAAGGYAYAITDVNSDVPLIGASGAVAGIVAAYLMLHPKIKIWVLFLGRIPLRLSAQFLLGAWILYQIGNAAFAPDGQIAWSAHIGGILAGAVLVVVFRRRGVPLFDKGM